jgi:O-methyltransferase
MMNPPRSAGQLTLKERVRLASRKLARVTTAHTPMEFPPYPAAVAQRIERYKDDRRYVSLALALDRIARENIPGAFAEIGVYRGETSAFLHAQSPERTLYLFDTFEGFPEQDLDGRTDTRFRDTSQESVAAFLGDCTNVVFRKGYFPATAAGLEQETFAFVMLDVDIYPPALACFEFFYPRLARGGYFFMHDYNSPESDYAIQRACTAFLKDKPELVLDLPDILGSAVFRKI